MGQHSCRPGPLPPASLNLAPASGDPAPPPPAGAGLGEPAGEAPAPGGGGWQALVKGRWEGVYREGAKGSRSPRRTFRMRQGLIGVRVSG